MKNISTLLIVLFVALTGSHAQGKYENRFERPLGDLLNDLSTQFEVRFSYDVDTSGLVLPFADYRIRSYSLEESLQNILAPFDMKFVKQNERYYKIKTYEHSRRTEAEGEKMLNYLSSLYHDKESWEVRKKCLRKEVRSRLEIDRLLSERTEAEPLLSELRRFDGYSVQNFALETLPGLYVTGSIYAPSAKGKHPVIISPNGHFADGRYREDQQLRMATLARMGAICVSYDLFGWGESAHQVGNVAHRSSAAQVIQALNGITILDYMLRRSDVDAGRVGVSGASGGGSQTVLLSVIDDRYTAAAPVVMVSSHFDGGCPCESGMPIFLACGGTNNAELAALFAPRPLLLVSDGGDWTSTTPTLEYPFLQRIYHFYGAADQVQNVHLADEGHDFGVNKRKAVYEFFTRCFKLDDSKQDESRVTIEPYEALMSFGNSGEGLPPSAIRSFEQLAPYFDKQLYVNLLSDLSLEKKAKEWTAALKLENEKDAAYVSTLIYNHLRAVRDWHNNHPYTIIPKGINPLNGEPLTDLDRQMIADSAMPQEVHERLMKGLRSVLSEEQVEAVLDSYTVGKVDFTMRGYRAIVPDLTAEEEAALLEYLKTARERAIDYKSMKQISAIFEIYKTKCEQYLIGNGRDWRKLYKDFVNKINEEKKKANK